MKSIFNVIVETWFTGLLYLLAGFGFVFYGILHLVRTVQTRIRLILPVFIGSLVLALVLWSVSSLYPAGQSGAEVECVLGPGASLRDMAHDLASRGVIRSELMFRAVIKFRGIDRTVMAGRYSFYVNDGVLRAVDRLVYPEAVEIAVTIPEGLTLEQIAGIYAAALKTDSAAFVEACSDTGLARRHGIAAASLEGYLFPDTYRFPPVARPREILERMLTRFDTIWASVKDHAQGAGAKLSREQAVALASIVEKEAALRTEQPHISGVFHNRLRIRMPLGADPTVRYIFRKFTGPLYKSELRDTSAYNTRVRIGLPPGPICSPGRGAIAAALAPATTPDLYFVARWDGSGIHDFSVSYEEHLRKTRLARQANEKVRMEEIEENLGDDSLGDDDETEDADESNGD